MTTHATDSELQAGPVAPVARVREEFDEPAPSAPPRVRRRVPSWQTLNKRQKNWIVAAAGVIAALFLLWLTPTEKPGKDSPSANAPPAP